MATFPLQTVLKFGLKSSGSERRLVATPHNSSF